MKIWLQEITGKDSSELVGKQGFLRIARQAASPRTKIDLGHVKIDFPKVTYNYSYGRHLSKQLIMEGVIKAWRMGYDGAIVNCWMDPSVGELREILDIPVVGLAEPSIHLAFFLGDKFGAITAFDTQVPEITEHISLYGAKEKAITKPVRGMGLLQEEIPLIVTKPKKIKAKFIKIARECIKDGAEVIISACSCLSPMLINEGVTDVDGAPIVEPISAAVKMVETLVYLKKDPFKLNVSRIGRYRSPKKEELHKIRKAFGLE